MMFDGEIVEDKDQEDLQQQRELLLIEGSPLRWFRFRTPSGHLSLEVFQARPTERRP